MAEHLVTYHSEDELKTWCLSKSVLEMYVKIFSHTGSLGDQVTKMIKDENYNVDDDAMLNLQKLDD